MPSHEQDRDQIVDGFEADWRAGGRPDLAARLALAATPDARQNLLEDLLPIDLEYRLQRGEIPTSSEYQAYLTEGKAEWLEQCIAGAHQEWSAGNSSQRGLAIGGAKLSLAAESPVSPSQLEGLVQLGPPLQATEEVPRQHVTAAVGVWQPGDVRGDYELIELLGEGGMGTVYKARHRLLNRIVALKQIRREYALDSARVARFRREIEATARLPANPHTVLATDAREIDGSHCLVMEFVEGSNLETLVCGVGPLSPREVSEIARQAAIGLQLIHRHEIIHRDIKPSNVIVDASGIVKILDLGLARLRASTDDPQSNTCTGTPPGALMGTFDYMAPEQWRDAGSVSVQTDLYALGCTLYFLLTGVAPFQQHTTLPAKYLAHLTSAPQPLSTHRNDVPAALSSLVDSLLAKKPEERCQSSRQVMEVVTELARGADLCDLLRRTGRTPHKSRFMDTSVFPNQATTAEIPIPAGRPADPKRMVPRLKPGPFRLWVAVGSVVVIATTLALLFVLPGPWKSNAKVNTPSNVRPSEPSTTAKAAPRNSAKDVDVWIRRNRDDSSITHYSLVSAESSDDRPVLPVLNNTDDFNLRIQLRTSTPWRLVWFDTRGKASIVAASATPSDSIRYPSDSTMISINPQDPSGAHLLALIVSQSTTAFHNQSWLEDLNGLGRPPQVPIASKGSTRGAGSESKTSEQFAPEYFARLEKLLPRDSQLVETIQIRATSAETETTNP